MRGLLATPSVSKWAQLDEAGESEGTLGRTEANLSRWEEAGAAITPLGPQFSHLTNKAVGWVSFLLLHSKAEREALWVGLSPGTGVSPQSLGPGQKSWSLQRQITSFLQAIALFFFSSPFGGI